MTDRPTTHPLGTDPATDPRADAAPAGSEVVRRQNRDTNWGRLSYIALGLLTLAIIWGLVLTSILLTRSGQTTSAVLDQLADNQQLRAHALADLHGSVVGLRARGAVWQANDAAISTRRRPAAQS